MKTILCLSVLSFLLPAIGHAARVQATVVATQAETGADLAARSSGQSISYVAHDAGYIEAGDPVSGEVPPSAAFVRSALEDALANAGYQPARSADDASLLLIYHWGVIRRDSIQLKPPFRIHPNLRARVALVASPKVVKRAEDYFNGFRLPYIEPDLRDAFEYARGGHYFVIVSAYRHADLDRGEEALVWRTRISAPDTDGPMDRVIASLISGSAPYLGQALRDPEFLRLPLVEVTAPSAPASVEIDGSRMEEIVRALAKNEHEEFAGRRDPSREGKPAATKTSTVLTPELERRVAEYRREKAALQEALAAEIRNTAPGAETRRAIDAFNAAQARRIEALERTREEIRSDLARLSAGDAAGDQSLAALQREFASEVHAMESHGAASHR